MKIGTLIIQDHQFFFECPFENMGVVPCVVRQRIDATHAGWNAGCFDFSKSTPVHCEDGSRGYVPEDSVPVKNPHWSVVAMVRLAQDIHKKTVASDDPSAFARLAAESAAGFRQWDGREKANWRRDLLILAECGRWEAANASSSQRFLDAEKNGIVKENSATKSKDKEMTTADLGAKQLSTRIARLSKKYFSVK